MGRTLTENDIKIQKLGSYGELCAKHALEARGHKVEFAESQFDYQKDLLVNDKIKVEVKTQRFFNNWNAFSFNEKQIDKIMNADSVIFVQVPHPDYPDSNDGAIFAYNHNEIVANRQEPKDVNDGKGGKRKSYPITRDTNLIIGWVNDYQKDMLETMKTLFTGKRREKKSFDAPDNGDVKL